MHEAKLGTWKVLFRLGCVGGVGTILKGSAWLEWYPTTPKLQSWVGRWDIVTTRIDLCRNQTLINTAIGAHKMSRYRSTKWNPSFSMVVVWGSFKCLWETEQKNVKLLSKHTTEALFPSFLFHVNRKAA